MAGILLGRASDGMAAGAAALLCALGAALLLREPARGAALLCAVCAAGCLAGYAGYHPAMPAEGDYLVRGVVSGEILSGEKGQVKTTLCDVTLNGDAVPGNAYWSFYPDALPQALTPGCLVTFKARVYHPSGAENPGGFDFREYLLQRGIAFGLYGCDGLTADPYAGISLGGLTARLRHLLTQGLKAAMGEEQGGYAATMLLNARSLIPSEDRETFSRLGIAHLLSVSGFHVGVLAAMLGFVLRGLRVRRKAAFAVTAAVLCAYCLLSGMSASVLRATTLTLLYGYGKLRHRRGNGLHLLAASAILTLLLSPAQLTGASFQLSYGAVLGLMLFTPWLRAKGPWDAGWKGCLWRSVCASLGAQLGVFLPLASFYQELPVLSVVLNLVALPLGALLLGCYWAVLLLLPLAPLARLAGIFAAALTDALTASVRYLGEFSWVSVWIRQANLWTGLGWAAVLLALSPWHREGRRQAVLAGAGAAVIALSLVCWPFAGTEYVQLSVGSADAAVLRDGASVTVIDTGEDGETLTTYLRQRRLSVDTLILTHLHGDHAGGVRALLDENIPVKTCCIPWGAEDTAADSAMTGLLEELAERGTEVRTLARGDVWTLPSGEITVVWPEEGRVRPGQDPNASSLTLRCVLSGTSMLLTGDLTGDYESYAALPSDILKVAHHGSGKSTSEELIAAVSPQAAILSGGDSARLEAVRERMGSIPLYGTYERGAVIVDFAKDGFTVRTMKQAR